MGAKAGGASVQLGYGYEMEAIAACTIGGVSVTGGRGKVSSALVGVAVFEFLKAALQFLGVNAYAQYIALGCYHLHCYFTGYQKIHCKKIIKKYIMLHTGPPFWYDGPFFIYTVAK